MDLLAGLGQRDKKSSPIDALVGELKYRRNGFGQMLRKPCLFVSLIDFDDKCAALATDSPDPSDAERR